jgi:ATP-binding cassette subfamily B protein
LLAVSGAARQNFSGGPEQRLSIARACQTAKILILDYRPSPWTPHGGKIQQALSARDSDALFFLCPAHQRHQPRRKILVRDDGRWKRPQREQLLKSCEIYRSIAVSQLGQRS